MSFILDFDPINNAKATQQGQPLPMTKSAGHSRSKYYLRNLSGKDAIKFRQKPDRLRYLFLTCRTHQYPKLDEPFPFQSCPRISCRRRVEVQKNIRSFLEDLVCRFVIVNINPRSIVEKADEAVDSISRICTLLMDEVSKTDV